MVKTFQDILYPVTWNKPLTVAKIPENTISC